MPDIIENQLNEIVLFGSPAVGLKKFKTFYDELNEKTIRIVNGSDVVPFTPPLFYHHIGQELWIRKDKINNNKSWLARLSYSLKLPIKNFIDNHGMESYIESLKQILKNESDSK